MFIAHLPAGYLFAKLLQTSCVPVGGNQRHFIQAAMVGSVIPDIDLLWFYFVADRATHHHGYWTHLPILWLLFAATAFCLYRRQFWREKSALMVAFALGGVLHLVLDSVVGQVQWLFPFSDVATTLVTVPALYQPWWFNFLFHWTALVEIAIVVAAFYVWRKTRQPQLTRH
ncbi:metal-dependent hydrolase [Thaumasiovibrio subtropicus]|uniref:metal-dependent hydrolase n=1 Tax=Thaumasiovibrio subtropicus TaxID=1891207 RepID=UPI000B355936|nr:metal-dependent hydrolase [Thaumasiovibrio subtropicus]